MKLTVGAFSLLFAAGAAMAGTDFPYADSLENRYSLTTETQISSFEAETSVPKVGGGMSTSEHVAVITAEVANFTASDPEDWTAGTNSVGNLQASLSMTYNENDELSWMGYTATGWVPLTGGTPTEGAWSVKIEIDYSVPTKAVRYSVKASGASNYTVLKADSCEWLQLGGNEAKVKDIGLLGYGTVNSVSGDCAARPFDDSLVATSSSFNMQYEKLKVTVTGTNVWGDAAKVTLKKVGDSTWAAEKSGALKVNPDGSLTFVADFSDDTSVVVGEEYTYDVTFMKGVEELNTSTDKGSVKLYSEIDWFGFDGGEFVNATTNKIAINANGFASADDEIIGDVNPVNSSGDGLQTTVETMVIVAGVSPIDELPTEVGQHQQFAVSLATDNGVRKWAYRVGDGKWEKSDATVATENGTYYVTVKFDYRDGKKTGTCWVRPENGADVVLTNNFELGEATKLAGTSVLGGDVGRMNASFKTVSPAPIEPQGNTITVGASNAQFDLANARATSYGVTETGSGHFSWKDSSDKYATYDGSTLTMHDGTPANGLSSYESYLLDLDAEDATSKPLVETEQVADASQIKFVLSGVNPKPESETGVAVSYTLQAMDEPNGEVKTEARFEDGAATVDLPASGAKYYKVNIKTTK